MLRINSLWLFIAIISCYSVFTVDSRLTFNENGTKLFSGSNVNNNTSMENPQARCYDNRLANILNAGLSNYAHDMGALSKYILDQIVRARYGGNWFVHCEMIQSQRQGLEWQSVTNGDLFSPTSSHGCYYHDTQTYVIILKY